MVMMGRLRSALTASPRSMGFILYAFEGGAMRREVGQAAGSGQVRGEQLMDSSSHES